MVIRTEVRVIEISHTQTDEIQQVTSLSCIMATVQEGKSSLLMTRKYLFSILKT